MNRTPPPSKNPVPDYSGQDFLMGKGGVTFKAAYVIELKKKGGQTMTISEAIEICDRLVPNAYTETDKVRWLMSLDQLIYKDVITTHEGAADVTEPVYTAGDMTRELIVSEPYAEDVYVNYLQAKVAQNNGEDAKYNRAITFYNDAYTIYARAYNEAHKAIPPRTYFRF